MTHVRVLVNPFAGAESAVIYARGRPDHHPRTIRRLASLLPTGTTIGAALDVACGPGHSTRALSAITPQVVGVDAALGMVQLAGSTTTHPVAAARAERLPFQDGLFGLVVVASGVHWLDQDAFFVEARRVLTAEGVIAITEHFFLGQMEADRGFADWTRDRYSARYPTPPRGRHLSVTDDVPNGLEVISKDGWLDPISMTHEQLIDYLLTQSNTIAAVDAGIEDRTSIRHWLDSELRAFFDRTPTRTLRFWGSVVVYHSHT